MRGGVARCAPVLALATAGLALRGEAQYVAAPPFGIPATAFGTSPVGPAFQDDWLDLRGTIARYPLG